MIKKQSSLVQIYKITEKLWAYKPSQYNAY